MSPVYALFAVVAAVLAVSGAFKVRDPAPTVPALRVLHLPSSPLAARAYGAVELAVGVAAIVVGGPALAVAVALLFVLFAGIVLRMLRLGDAAPSCGCFGRLSSKPSPLHAVVDLLAAGVAGYAAAARVPGLGASAEEGAGAAEVATGGLSIALATASVVALLTVLPDTLDATRRGPAPAGVREFEITEGAL